MPGGFRVRVSVRAFVRVRSGPSVTHVKKPGDQTVRCILASSIIPGWQPVRSARARASRAALERNKHVCARVRKLFPG